MPEKQVEKNENAYDEVEAALDAALAPLREMRKLDPKITEAFRKGLASFESSREGLEALEKRIDEVCHAVNEQPEVLMRFYIAHDSMDDSAAMINSEKQADRVVAKMSEFYTYVAVIRMLVESGSVGERSSGHRSEPGGRAYLRG